MSEPLTALIVAREVLRLMALCRDGHLLSPPLIPEYVTREDIDPSRYGSKQYAAIAWLPHDAMGWSLDRLSDNALAAMAVVLVRDLPPVAHYAILELPEGIDAANEAFQGYALRCCIDHPPAERAPCPVDSVFKGYYSAEHHEYRYGACCSAIRVDMVPREV